MWPAVLVEQVEHLAQVAQVDPLVVLVPLESQE